jgi:sulfur relay (sulfurtransferase) DsrC/TusE family protein
MTIVGEQTELFPDITTTLPLTDYEVAEKLAIARDEAKTLLTHLATLVFLHDDNDEYGTNPFIKPLVNKEIANQLHESTRLIYTCLDVAINRYWSVETTI